MKHLETPKFNTTSAARSSTGAAATALYVWTLRNDGKKMRFIAQDLPKNIASAPKYGGDIGDRVTFQAHDFMTEQPVNGAGGEFTSICFFNGPIFCE